jgi:hypothetical protein
MSKPPHLPSPSAIRSKLKREAAKQGAASLSRKIGVPYAVLWNFISGRTEELKHTDLSKCLGYLVNAEASKSEKP